MVQLILLRLRLGHTSIHADYVPTFTNNLITIMDNGAVDTIQHDKIVIVILDRDPYVDELVEFVISYSSQRIVVLTGAKSQDLFVTPLSSPRQALCLSTPIISIFYMIWCIILFLFSI